MRFYIAGNLNKAGYAKLLGKVLERLGHVNTYDWTEHDDVRAHGEAAMADVSYKVGQAIKDSDYFLALLPGNRDTHMEIGFALASRYGKRIILWSETGEEFSDPERASILYFHPSVTRFTCSFNELIKTVKEI